MMRVSCTATKAASASSSISPPRAAGSSEFVMPMARRSLSIAASRHMRGGLGQHPTVTRALRTWYRNVVVAGRGEIDRDAPAGRRHGKADPELHRVFEDGEIGLERADEVAGSDEDLGQLPFTNAAGHVVPHQSRPRHPGLPVRTRPLRVDSTQGRAPGATSETASSVGCPARTRGRTPDRHVGRPAGCRRMSSRTWKASGRAGSPRGDRRLRPRAQPQLPLLDDLVRPPRHHGGRRMGPYCIGGELGARFTVAIDSRRRASDIARAPPRIALVSLKGPCPRGSAGTRPAAASRP